jgi:hypothetical protein
VARSVLAISLATSDFQAGSQPVPGSHLLSSLQVPVRNFLISDKSPIVRSATSANHPALQSQSRIDALSRLQRSSKQIRLTAAAGRMDAWGLRPG